VDPVTATLDAIVTLNLIVRSEKFLDAINGSTAMKEALATPASKTVLCPSDVTVGSITLSDDILLGFVFEGNLTAATLSTVTTILAINGERYDVLTRVVSTRNRREVKQIRIANNRSSVILTVLDIPAGNNVVHGVDGVLFSDSSSDNTNSSNKSGGWSNAEYWLYACAVLFVLLVVAVIVAVRRSSRLSSVTTSDEKAEIVPPDFAAIDWGLGDYDANARRGHTNYLDLSAHVPSQHFYPENPDWWAAAVSTHD
jgi:hypothetical protein